MKKFRLIPVVILFVFGNSLFLLQAVAQQERARTAGVYRQAVPLMPYLIGKDVGVAEQELKNIFKQLKVGKNVIENQRCTPGRVMDQSPSAQSPLYSETPVVLYYCKKESGRGEAVIGVIGGMLKEALKETEVPDVRRLSVREAKQKLKASYLKAKFRSKEDEADELRVSEQSEAPGKKVRVNSSVRLTVEQPQDPPISDSRQRRQREKPPKEWIVPEVTGKTLEEAIRIIEGAELVVGTQEKRETPDGSNLIAFQTPEPNTKVKQQTPVNLVIAVQRKQVIVPNLRNLSLSQAEQELNRSGLNRGYVVGVSARMPGAVVASQSRAPGSQVDRGSAIGVTLAVPSTPTPTPTPTPKPTPTPTPLAIVPNLRGQTRDEASQSLRKVGLNLGQFTTQPSNSLEGTVIDQLPLAGDRVAVATAVNVVLASPTPTPTPTPVSTSQPLTPVAVTVPDLGGLSRDEASRNLLAVNLSLGQVTVQPSNSVLGKVFRQEPEPGAQVEAGSAVNVVLAATPTPTVTPTPALPSPPPEDWLTKLIAQIPKVLGVAGLGFFGLLLAGLLKRLFKAKPGNPPPSLTSPTTPAVAKPKLEYRARTDQGTQAIEAETRLSLPFELSLRPRPDAGRQWIEVAGQLIANERSEA